MTVVRGNEMDRLPLSALRPTQITVGMDYVEAKALITARYRDAELERFLRDHAINVVLGPGREPYVIDHHHWARAWFNLGFSDAPVTVVADLSRLGYERFWKKMEANGWVHPLDENGKRCQVNDLPLTIGDMIDDPYHSLAAFARRAGAYRKPKGAYGSFVWSDFLRVHVPMSGIGAGPFSLALLRAIKIARSDAAAEMPGYISGKRR
jgi:hypothetical protein